MRLYETNRHIICCKLCNTSTRGHNLFKEFSAPINFGYNFRQISILYSVFFHGIFCVILHARMFIFPSNIMRELL